LSPARAALVISTQTRQFTASASGASWSVDNVVGGNSTVGAITSSGLYTPPAKAGTHTIRASGGGSSGSATVYVTDLKGVLPYHNDNAPLALPEISFIDCTALDVFTGSEKYNAPVTIAASVPGTSDGS
jgi:hypothetical protein